MDEWQLNKPPREFIGQGFEIIGDPVDSLESGSLSFQDGVFVGLQLPSQELDSNVEWQKRERRETAERLALHYRDHPADKKAKAELKAILKQCRDERPQDKATERAVKSIREGGPATNWPAQDQRQRAAVIALMQTAKELCRPPTEAEVIDRMRKLRDSLDKKEPLLTASETKQLAAILRGFGFSWLERTPRGRPRS